MEQNSNLPPKQFWGVRNLPNIITSMNLFAGSVGVWFAFNGNFVGAAVAVLLAALFDFLDGTVARLLKAYSDIGKELDSLADVISFGLVPGAVIFTMLSGDADFPNQYAFLAFVITIFSAVRLAKFNVDERQTSSFIGLPTPANAIFWVGISISYTEWFTENHIALLVLTFIFSYLLVAEIPMFSLKFKSLKWKNNQLQYIFLISVLLVIILLQADAIAPIIVLYILVSIVNNLLIKRNTVQ